MSVYFVKGKDKGWRYDFTHKRIRYTEAWFKTKTKAKEAEAKQREKLKNPKPLVTEETGQTDMGFLDLINKRLDHVKAYNSERHYTDHIYLARRWVKEWEGLNCSGITTDMIQAYLLKRMKETSPFTANKDLRYLRSLFNYGLHPMRNWITHNPTRCIEFFPVDKQIKYVPPNEDVLRVILAADPDIQDYLWTIALTMGRMSEVNRLAWQDVDFTECYVVLYTRKKKGGHRTPRKIPMTDKLFEVLSRRYANRNKRVPWVFWHRYWSPKISGWTVGPFKERKKIMRTLCKRAGVKYFRYHAFRHFGASLLEQANVPIGSIQRLLGHQNRTTTELYLHSIGESERQAMDVLNERFESFSHTDSHTNIKGDMTESS